MIVALRLEVSNEVRRALRKRQERSGLAGRAEVKRELLGIWERFVHRAEEPVPLEAPALPKVEQRRVDLALFTTSTLKAEIAARGC